jgi:hypothetical protein
MSQTDSAHEARLLSLPRRDQSYGSMTDEDHSSPRQGARSVSVGSSTENDNSTRRRRRMKLPKVKLSLVNSGSVARDHLASERTFLAYVRTSLAISSMGVGMPFVVPFCTVLTHSQPLYNSSVSRLCPVALSTTLSMPPQIS